ncbi:pyrimidine utilization protein D [Falsirhodobacter algicola]|uniref:Pyrimidine utilization protein D n=1 Tax=Falsirhodobacter algicola TaxID=2692330 RepID=A0A8J8MVG3_9RHOB|nr:pyrimidine utilization protein D [Falsirhodobacter algicola]QUS37161.1 pyrimidine utilization protein D [Falsirhodobacter algicola]
MKYHIRRCGREGARMLVLCSGLGGARGYWTPHLEALEAMGLDVLLYDQRGCGENMEAIGPTRIADMADDVLAICDAAGVERFDLLGHALGGLVGFDLACRAGRRIDRVVAINAWPRIDAHTARCFDIRLATLTHQGLAAFAALQQNFLYPPFWIAAHPDRIAAEEAHAVAHFQGADTVRHRIGALRDFALGDWPEAGPEVLLISSTDDALVDAAQSRRLAERIPGARLLEYPQGGHALNITKQTRFEADLAAFLTH